MLAIAALTSAISLSEPTIAWLTERFGFGRVKAVLLSGLGLWVLGLGSVFSFNLGAEYTLFGKTFFDALDYLTANLLMPVGGLLTVLFCGWVLGRAKVEEGVGIASPALFRLWWQILCYVTPLCILVVFLHSLGLF
jgi:NSS family neurotransmitter:Na+ symporter